MKQYFRCILPFLYIIIGGVVGVFAFSNHKMLSKNEFYSKHHIENNTLMLQSFDMAECLRALTEIYSERYNNTKLAQDAVEDFIKLLNKNMIPPEQYDGFYPPKDKIIFYNVADKNNLEKLGLRPQDISELDLSVTDEVLQKWRMGMTVQQLENEGFYTIADTANLVAKVGDNIYLTGFYSDCGTSGCPIKIMVKNQEKWLERKSDIFFDFCVAAGNKLTYECSVSGGDNTLWHYVADYAPLAELSDRYYEVWKDYVEQYLQNKNDFLVNVVVVKKFR